MKADNQMSFSSNEGQIKQFIKYLKDGEKLIVAAYNGNLSNESIINDFDTLHNLKEQRILMSAFNGYRLNPLLSRLLNSALNVDRSRYIDVGLKARLVSIQRITESYIDHVRASESELASETLQDLEQLTFEIIFDAQVAISSLANRLQTKFGFVHSLRDKITENESAIDTAGELVANLTAFSFNDMMEYVHNCNDDHELYNILCINLLDELAKCQSKLNSILNQLREMLAVFRKQVRQTSLLKSFCNQYYKQRGYLPANYVADKIPHELFLKAEALKLAVHADIHNDSQNGLLIEVVNNLKSITSSVKTTEALANSSEFEAPPEILEEKTVFYGLEDDLIIFFKEVINSRKAISAVNYYKAKKLDYPQSHWLFAVSAYFEDMAEENKIYFDKAEYLGTRQLAEQDIGDTILEDIIIKLRKDLAI